MGTAARARTTPTVGPVQAAHGWAPAVPPLPGWSWGRLGPLLCGLAASCLAHGLAGRCPASVASPSLWGQVAPLLPAGVPRTVLDTQRGTSSGLTSPCGRQDTEQPAPPLSVLRAPRPSRVRGRPAPRGVCHSSCLGEACGAGGNIQEWWGLSPSSPVAAPWWRQYQRHVYVLLWSLLVLSEAETGSPCSEASGDRGGKTLAVAPVLLAGTSPSRNNTALDVYTPTSQNHS